jgi:hypothetical protein
MSATALAALLFFYDLLVENIAGILIYTIPILLLAGLSGFVLALIGAVTWSLRFPLQKLTWLGLVLMALGVLFFLVINRINFGFDNPGVLFAQLITFAPMLIGLVFLVAAGIRRLRDSPGIASTEVR